MDDVVDVLISVLFIHSFRPLGKFLLSSRPITLETSDGISLRAVDNSWSYERIVGSPIKNDAFPNIR